MNLRDTHIIGPRTLERIIPISTWALLTKSRIRLAGLSDARRGFRFVRNHPNMLQVLACYEGWGMVLVDGRWQRCGPGQAYITPPVSLHAYHATNRVRWRLAWIHFDGKIDALQTRAIDRPMLRQVEPQGLVAAIAGMHRETVSVGETAMIRAWGRLVELAGNRMIAPRLTATRLHKVWQQVDRDLARPWTVDDLAEIVDLSEEHLRRLCIAEIGTSPMRHVANLRMQRSASLLESTKILISDIARAVGYENPFAFSTAFNRHFGRSPSQHRAMGAIGK